MAYRQRYKDLPKSFKSVIKKISKLKEPISPLDASRKFEGPTIKRLVAEGHLNSAAVDGRKCLIISPLTEKEMKGHQPWTSDDDRALREQWAKGDNLYKISTVLGRQPGIVLTRAHQIRVRRVSDGEIEFSSCVMRWRRKKLRIMLIEAERRGLDINDGGDGLMWHRSLLRRFHLARNHVSAPPSEDAPRWDGLELASVRGLRDKGKSVAFMAFLLKRDVEDVARRLVLEGRLVNGYWSDVEDAKIAHGMRHGLRPSAIAGRLKNRTTQEVKGRIDQLFRNRRVKRPWTAAELQLLVDYHVAGFRGFALTDRFPCRGHHAIRRQLYGLLKEPREGKPWEVADVNIMTRALMRDEPVAEVAKWLGRDLESVERLYHFKADDRSGRRSILSRSDAIEVKRLREQEGVTQEEIAKRFGVSRATIYRVTKVLEEEDLKERRWGRERPSMRRGRRTSSALRSE